MATPALNGFLDNLRRSLTRPGVDELSDAELVRRYLADRADRSGDREAAFEELVRRHGPMVLGVCRRVLRNEADAEDAFQATFVVLARRASAVRPREAVGHWLYGVAVNTARKARAMATRRRERDRKAGLARTPAGDPPEALDVLDEELAALPELYRAPIVLCELEGKSLKEAAEVLRCPPATVGTRLARGRRLLADRLARRGVAAGAVGLAFALGPPVRATVPPALVASTTRAAAGAASPPVAALTHEVLKAMFLSKLKFASAAVLTGVLLLGAAFGTRAQSAPDGPPGAQAASAAALALTAPAAPAVVAPNAPAVRPPKAGQIRPPVAADDPETKWPEETPRILELQPFLFGPRHDGTKILSVCVVAKELKLTEKQLDELFKIDLELSKKEGDRVNRKQEWTEAYNAALPRILKPAQVKRFRQLNLQLLGTPLGGVDSLGGALRFPEVQEALKLDATQLDKLQKIAAEVQAALAKEPRVDYEVLAKYHKVAADAAHGLLTDEQTKAWKKMTGEPFEYTNDQYRLEKGEYVKVGNEKFDGD